LYKPRCEFTNKSKRVLQCIASVLDGEGIPYRIWTDDRAKNKNPTHTLQVCGFDGTYRLLEKLHPYLVGKRRVAELTLQWCKRRLSLPHKAPQDENDFAYVEAIREANRTPCERVPDLSEEDALHWFAGFFDAEGSIRAVLRPELCNALSFFVDVTSADRANLAVAKRVCQRLGVAMQWVSDKHYINNSQRVPAWRLQAQRRADIQALLEALAPLLVVKAEQARLVLDWFRQHPAGRGHSELADRLALLEALRSLKDAA